MLLGLVGCPFINEKIVDLFYSKINQDFLVEDLKNDTNILFLNFVSTNLFTYPQTLYSIINSNFILNAGDSVVVSYDDSTSETIKIKTWENFRALFSPPTHYNPKKIIKIRSLKQKLNTEIDFESLFNMLLNQCDHFFFSHLSQKNIEIFHNFSQKNKNEKLQIILENLNTDSEEYDLIKKFISTYDLTYIILFLLKSYYKNHVGEYKKVEDFFNEFISI